MSEVQTEVVESVPEQANTEVDYKSLYEETQKKLETVAAHKDKLYQETKAAKAEREAAKQEAHRIEQEKAMKDGEFEKLWQTTKQEKDALMNQLNEFKNANKNEKIQIASLKVASELADGYNVEILSKFVQEKIAALADDMGQVAPDVVDAVMQDFKNNEKFKALLRGSKAAGGGATGGSPSGHSANKINRSEFDLMSHTARKQFLSKGGRLTD